MSDFLPRCLGDISNFINQGVDINSSSSSGANLPQPPARRLHPSETREPKASRRWAGSAATAATPRRPPSPRVPLDEREEISQETQPIHRLSISCLLLGPGLRGRITFRWVSVLGAGKGTAGRQGEKVGSLVGFPGSVDSGVREAEYPAGVQA